MRGKPYTKEFRKNIVRLHLEEKRTLKSLGTEYGVSVSTVSWWIIYHKNKSIRDVKNRNSRIREA